MVHCKKYKEVLFIAIYFILRIDTGGLRDGSSKNTDICGKLPFNSFDLTHQHLGLWNVFTTYLSLVDRQAQH